MDPASAVNKESRLLAVVWLALAAGVLFVWGPAFWRLTWPDRVRVVDFFQDWSTARNYRAGRPIYAPQDVALERYLGLSWDVRSPLFREGSTRPPSCVLLTLPLGMLDYRAALGVWNLGSLCCLAVAVRWLVLARGFALGGLAIVRLATLALLCNPLLVQLYQGQWSLVLLLLLTAAWRAERRERWLVAGALLGCATAIKLFPGLLITGFLVRRNWRGLAGWAGSVLALNFAALLLFGPVPFVDYIDRVLPALTTFRGHALDASLAGFWHRLFEPMIEVGGLRVEPLVTSTAAARLLTALSRLAVIGIWVWRMRGSATPAACEGAFAGGVVAMLLVAPITWDHYLLMLLLPIVLLWPDPARSASDRRARRVSRSLVGCVAVLFVPPTLLHQMLQRAWQLTGAPATAGPWTATPWESLLVLALPTYVLLWLFLFSLKEERAAS